MDTATSSSLLRAAGDAAVDAWASLWAEEWTAALALLRLLAGLVLAWVLWRLSRYLLFVARVERLPGPMALPLLGNSLQLLRLQTPTDVMYVGTAVAVKNALKCTIYCRFHNLTPETIAAAHKYRNEHPLVQWQDR